LGCFSYFGCHITGIFVYGFNARIPSAGARASLIFI